jgi:hypothetical protein
MRTCQSLNRALFGALCALALAPLAAAGHGFTTVSVGIPPTDAFGLSGSPATSAFGAKVDRRDGSAELANAASAIDLRARRVGPTDPAIYDETAASAGLPAPRYISAGTRWVDRSNIIILVLAERRPGRPRFDADELTGSLPFKHTMPAREALALRTIAGGGVQKHEMSARAVVMLRAAAAGRVDVEPELGHGEVLKHLIPAREVATLRVLIADGLDNKALTLFGAGSATEPLVPLGELRPRGLDRRAANRRSEEVRFELEVAVPIQWLEGDPHLVLVAR